MNRSKFTEAQIVFALRQAETGIKVEEVCRKIGILTYGNNYIQNIHLKINALLTKNKILFS